MSEQIPLAAIPNQDVSITLDGSRFDIAVKSSSTSTLISIIRDDVTLISGLRAVGGTLVLPYEYLEEGNFYFETPNEVIPYYENFGISQFLIYMTAAEIEAIRGTN